MGMYSDGRCDVQGGEAMIAANEWVDEEGFVHKGPLSYATDSDTSTSFVTAGLPSGLMGERCPLPCALCSSVSNGEMAVESYGRGDDAAAGETDDGVVIDLQVRADPCIIIAVPCSFGIAWTGGPYLGRSGGTGQL